MLGVNDDQADPVGDTPATLGDGDKAPGWFLPWADAGPGVSRRDSRLSASWVMPPPALPWTDPAATPPRASREGAWACLVPSRLLPLLAQRCDAPRVCEPRRFAQAPRPDSAEPRRFAPPILSPNPRGSRPDGSLAGPRRFPATRGLCCPPIHSPGTTLLRMAQAESPRLVLLGAARFTPLALPYPKRPRPNPRDSRRGGSA
jgi:hypothetical protein